MGLIKKVQFNPSTLKAIYNPATSKVQMTDAQGPGECGGCGVDCYAEIGYESSLCCFDTGKTPKYLCAKFTDIKRCSDNSTIPTFYVCCVQRGGAGINNSIWDGSVVLDGVSCNVMIDWSGAAWDSVVSICRAGAVYYFGWTAGFCAKPVNRLVIGDCGNDVQCMTGGLNWFDTTCVGYNGDVDVCNPINGDWIVSC